MYLMPIQETYLSMVFLWIYCHNDNQKIIRRNRQPSKLFQLGKSPPVLIVYDANVAANSLITRYLFQNLEFK